MKLARVAAMLIALSPVPAAAQQLTKDQCGLIAKGMQPMAASMADIDKLLMAIDWSLVVRQSSGSIRASSEVARQTQAEFIVALKKYRNAIQDVAYQAQICAR